MAVESFEICVMYTGEKWIMVPYLRMLVILNRVHGFFLGREKTFREWWDFLYSNEEAALGIT